MFKLFKFLRPRDWMFMILNFGLILLQVYLELTIPDYMSDITRILITPNIDNATEQVLIKGGYMLLCALGSFACAVTINMVATYVGTSFAKKVRQTVFYKVNSFSLEEINHFSTASLITRSTNDIVQVQNFVVMSFQIFLKAPVFAIWAIAKISSKSWQWTFATAISVVALMALIIVLIIFVLPRFKIIQTLTDNLNKVTRENLTGVRVVRAYNAEDFQEEKFNSANKKLTANYLFTTRTMAIMSPFMNVIMNGLSLSIYWIGAILIASAVLMEKAVLFSDMVVFSSYAMQVVMSFIMLTMLFIMYPRAAVSAKRINEILDKTSSIVDGNGVNKTSIKGEVEFKNVSFKYPDAESYILKDISFHALPGQTVAFIGSTGSGKSTLINLIPRFYDATDGEILIDGENIKDYKLDDLYKKMGYVSQKAILFRGTIESNIAYGEKGDGDFTSLDIEEAASIAQGQEFIENLEEKYSASVAQGGTNFSGGQKQRIAIARAVARDPEIFIFDDSFSALDYKTDKVLRTELKKRMTQKTSFIVAQRIGTIIDADQIVVLDCGEVVGIGTHDELMKSCKIYQEIAYSQLSKEELNHGK